MKTTHQSRRQSGAIVFAVTLAVAGGFVSINAADEKPAKKDKSAAKPTQEEMMKAWMEVATPGPAHKLLETYVGKWETTSKMWMAPGGEPMEAKGKLETKSILGGRFVESNFTGTMMGMPWEAKSFTGYDNFRKHYQTLWMDNMGTTMTLLNGKASPDGKTVTYSGTMDEPATGEKDKPFTVTDKHISKDEIVTELSTKVEGKDFKFLEMTNKRAK
jgi:Protein of unknown function (DUF1579)